LPGRPAAPHAGDRRHRRRAAIRTHAVATTGSMQQLALQSRGDRGSCRPQSHSATTPTWQTGVPQSFGEQESLRTFHTYFHLAVKSGGEARRLGRPGETSRWARASSHLVRRNAHKPLRLVGELSSLLTVKTLTGRTQADSCPPPPPAPKTYTYNASACRTVVLTARGTQNEIIACRTVVLTAR
jgi:hypothetical protein